MRLMRFFLFSLLLSSLSSSLAYAGEQDFVLVNKTGTEIAEVYVSASNKSDWEEDILGADTLADGNKLNIHFDPSETSKLWDIMVVDPQGGKITWQGINLKKTGVVTLHYNADTQEATATLE